MRKELHVMMISLGLWLSTLAVVAQTPLVLPDSALIPNGLSSTVAPGIGQTQIGQSRLPDRSLSKRIPVQAGDSVSISATVIGKTRRGRQVWGTIAKVVTPGFVIGALGAGKEKTPSLDDPIPASPTGFATTLAITPGAVNLLKKQAKSRTFIGIAAYDTSGQQINSVITSMTNTGRKGGQTLEAGYRVTQDGYVTILSNRNGSTAFTGNSDDPNQWIRFGLHRTKMASKEISTSDSTGSARLAMGGVDGSQINPGVGGPQTNSLEICIDWYECRWGGGCQYTGETQCYSLDDGGGGDNSNIGNGEYGGYDPANCAQCKRLAKNEHDKNLAAAKYTLYTLVLGGCHAGAGGVYISLNAAGWWVNIIPGIGPAAIQALSVLGAITADISCLAGATAAYNATEATIENSYFKDMNDCNEKYCTPPPRAPIPTPNN